MGLFVFSLSDLLKLLCILDIHSLPVKYVASIFSQSVLFVVVLSKN